MNELNIQRFVNAHRINFETALSELSAGRKISHWMWYIFPQVKGLGMSEMSMYYSIQSIDEAREYINNDYLRDHMNTLLDILLCQGTSNAAEIFASPDDMKLKSSMTLFAYVDSENVRYKKILDKFYSGNYDRKTLDIVNDMESRKIMKKLFE